MATSATARSARRRCARSGRSLIVGTDGRMRVDLGSNRAKLVAHQEPTMDALVGPVATALIGSVGILVGGGRAAGCVPRVKPAHGLASSC